MYSAILQVDVIIEVSENSGISFRKSRYELSTVENTTKISTVGLINVVGNLLFENVEYRILNPTKLFEIGKTSGAIKTTGIVFDREVVDKYKLIVEAMSTLYKNKQKYIRRSITHVDVCILDVNDNCPMFVNLPYYATVSQEDLKGTVVTQVKAIDLDSFENGEVRYEMKKGNGELFKVERKTGEIILKQPIEGHDRSYELIIAAYDGAIIPCSAEVSVSIKVSKVKFIKHYVLHSIYIAFKRWLTDLCLSLIGNFIRIVSRKTLRFFLLCRYLSKLKVRCKEN